MKQSIKSALDKGVYRCDKCGLLRGWDYLPCKYISGEVLTEVSCDCEDNLDDIDEFPNAVQYVGSSYDAVQKKFGRWKS